MTRHQAIINMAWLWHHFYLALDEDQTHDLPIVSRSSTLPEDHSFRTCVHKSLENCKVMYDVIYGWPLHYNVNVSFFSLSIIFWTGWNIRILWKILKTYFWRMNFNFFVSLNSLIILIFLLIISFYNLLITIIFKKIKNISNSKYLKKIIFWNSLLIFYQTLNWTKSQMRIEVYVRGYTIVLQSNLYYFWFVSVVNQI